MTTKDKLFLYFLAALVTVMLADGISQETRNIAFIILLFVTNILIFI